MAQFRYGLVVAAMCGALCTAQAQASSISYTSYTVTNDQDVTLVDAKLGVDVHGGSGQVNLNGTNTPGGSLATWCIDILHELQDSGTFGMAGPLTGSFALTANALLSHAASVIGGDYNASSALQVALWEAEYGSDLTVTAPQAVLNLAQTYLTDVANGTWRADPNAQILVAAGNGQNQSQAYLSRVPEPASVLALASGLLSLIGLRPRRT